MREGRPMTIRIRESAGPTYQLVHESGDLVRTTNGVVFSTPSEAVARTALGFLMKPKKNGRRTGPHHLKSMFGVF